MTHWDVIIIGGGSWGLSCAYSCAKRGRSVAVFDAGKIGDGASGGIVGAIAPHAPDSWNAKKQFQLNALLSAQAHWQKIDALSGQNSGYDRIGRLMPIQTKRDLGLHLERSELVKTHWQGSHEWNVLKSDPKIIAKHAPFGVLHDTLSARIFPQKAMQSLATACRLSGVNIFENHPVTDMKTGCISGAWGAANADAIILAAGAEGFSLLDAHLQDQSGAGLKGQAALLDIDLGNIPQIHTGGIYIIPHVGGVTAVGSTVEKKWSDLAPDHKLDVIIEKAGNLLPELKDASVLMRWAGVRPKARRRHPMLGPIPGLQNVYCAMGGYTIGFGIAHAVGQVLADFVAGIPVDLPKNFTVEWHME